jgi:O-antigen/teichoic acid export membrane protein
MVSGLEPAYEVGKLLRFSLPVLLVGCSHLLLGQTDRIMLGYFRASKDLGIYSAAAVISQQAGLITYSFGYIFCPIISDLYHRREFGDLQRLYKTVTRWIVSVNVVLLVLLILFSRQIMAIFGSEFTAGGLVLVVLAAAHLIGYVSGGALVGYVLRMSGKQDIELMNAIVLLVLNIVLNLWLIPLYGILGAAVATGISFTVISALRIAEVCLLLQMHPYDRNYHKSFVAAAVVVLLAVFLSRWTMTAPYWIFVMAALALLYFVVLFFLGLEYEDRMIWETIKSRISRPSLSTGTSR